MDPSSLRLLAVGTYALTRLVEWRRHVVSSRGLLAVGAHELIPRTMRLYYTLTWLVVPFMLLEAYWASRPEQTGWFIGGAAGLTLGFLLRTWAIQSLGSWWTMGCMAHPGLRELRVGPYRFLNHPEYIARFVEMLGLAAILMAPLTALCGGLLLAMTGWWIGRVESVELATRSLWAKAARDYTT